MTFAAIALLATAAMAEPEIGSRIDNSKGSVDYSDLTGKDASSRSMDRFARCRAAQRPKVASTILDLPYLSPEQQQALFKFADGGVVDACLGNDERRLTFAPPAMLGGMAEALILMPERKDARRALHPTAESLVAKAGYAPRNLAEDFAQCVVEQDPVTVLALVNSVVGGDIEARLLQQLTPNLGPCLSSGQKISLNKYSIRSTLAYGLYRLMPVLSAPSVPQQ
ncbi:MULTISPECIES: hypothetical protein [Sphingomonas]|uniref:hypothetical protein n=1 Tax=Sphingomonas TaxID=13687 RepID=UPI000DEF9B38|nr:MULTISPECIES: hypothetical protein [Sphingomonas]